MLKIRFLVPALAGLIAIIFSGGLNAAAMEVSVAGLRLAASPAPFVLDGKTYAPEQAAAAAFGVTLKTSGSHYLIEGYESSVPKLTRDGRGYVALETLAEKLGCYTESSSGKLNILAQVQDVRFTGGKLVVKTSIPVRYEAKRLTDPERIYLNIMGAKYDGPAAETTSQTSVIRKLRVGQFDPLTVRVVAETAVKLDYKINSAPRTREMVLSLQEPSSQTASSASTRADVSGQDISVSNPLADSNPESPKLCVIKGVRVEGKEDGISLIFKSDVKPVGMTPARFKTGEVTIELKRTALDTQVPLWSVAGPLVNSIRVEGRATAPPTTVITLKTNRVLLAKTVPGPESDEFTVEIFPPRGAEGDWRGKTIVIDAGHGGSDPGARANGIQEKDVNLAIAKVAAAEAAERGLNVVMTRDSDQTLTLRSRTDQIAATGANLFVSIHNNSNRRPNSATGTEVYYHKQDPHGRALAEVVHNAIVQASGMKPLGAKSDTRLYASGLFVLRNSGVPAILVEVGYVNHSQDAKKLANPEFQKRVGQAIVDGIMAYLGGPGAPILGILPEEIVVAEGI